MRVILVYKSFTSEHKVPFALTQALQGSGPYQLVWGAEKQKLQSQLCVVGTSDYSPFSILTWPSYPIHKVL